MKNKDFMIYTFAILICIALALFVARELIVLTLKNIFAL